MELSELNVGDVAAASLASTLLQTFGERAQSLAMAQAEKDAACPEVAAKWRAVAHAIAVMVQASVHMELALELLDSVEERYAAVRLDHAIAVLGVRQSQTLREAPK